MDGSAYNFPPDEKRFLRNNPTLTAPISDRTQPLHTTAPAGKRLTVHLDIGQQSSLAAAPFVAEFDHARRIEIRGMLHLEGEALVMMDIDAQCHAHGTQALLPMPYAILFEGTEIIEIGRLYTFVPRAYPFDYPARKQDAGAGKPLGRPFAEPLPATAANRSKSGYISLFINRSTAYRVPNNLSSGYFTYFHRVLIRRWTARDSISSFEQGEMASAPLTCIVRSRCSSHPAGTSTSLFRKTR